MAETNGNGNMRRGVVEPKKLSTGQTISLTPHEEKTLKHAYDYMAGYAKRLHLTSMVDKKKEEYKQFGRCTEFYSMV